VLETLEELQKKMAQQWGFTSPPVSAPRTLTLNPPTTPLAQSSIPQIFRGVRFDKPSHFALFKQMIEDLFPDDPTKKSPKEMFTIRGSGSSSREFINRCCRVFPKAPKFRIDPYALVGSERDFSKFVGHLYGGVFPEIYEDGYMFHPMQPAFRRLTFCYNFSSEQINTFMMRNRIYTRVVNIEEKP
jgi:hypothetical protein